MSENDSKTVLLPSLGRLVRGLSILFWTMPLAIVVGVHIARSPWPRDYGMLLVAFSPALLLYALTLMQSFHPGERPWIDSLDRARMLALVNLGLAPFLYWWRQEPANEYFLFCASLLPFAGLFLLCAVNLVLRRLAAMLPDETIRYETRLFTALNLISTSLLLLLLGGAISISHLSELPEWVQLIKLLMPQNILWMFVLPVLLPLAMTMALVWKIKEVILASIFGVDQTS